MADNILEQTEEAREQMTLEEREKEINDFSRGLLIAVHNKYSIPRGDQTSFVRYQKGVGGSQESFLNYNESVQRVENPPGKARLSIRADQDVQAGVWNLVGGRINAEWLNGGPLSLPPHDKLLLYYECRYPDPIFRPDWSDVKPIDKFGARIIRPKQVDKSERGQELPRDVAIRYWGAWMGQFSNNMKLSPQPPQR